MSEALLIARGLHKAYGANLVTSDLSFEVHQGETLAILPSDLGQLVFYSRAGEIPEPVRDVYRAWRPSPLYRAHRLEIERERFQRMTVSVTIQGQGRMA